MNSLKSDRQSLFGIRCSFDYFLFKNASAFLLRDARHALA